MPKIPMPYTVYLDHTLRVTPLSTLFAKGDSAAHRFELTIMRSGAQEDLTGCKVVCKFYRIAESAVVSVDGTIEDGKAVAVLNAACYDYIGRFALTIAIKNGEEETTVFYGDGYMSGNRADTGITGNYVVYDVETLLAKIAEIDTAIANANTSIANANTAAENANAAEENANAAASGAQSAAGSANEAASAAKTATNKANTAASAAETAASAANSAASSAQTATQNANAATQASQSQQQAVAEAEAARDTAEQERATAEQARQETFSGYEERIVAATPDDTTVNGRAWTSKKVVDSLCMPLEATGNPVQVYPVEGYPLGVKVSWEPTQEGEGDPSPENIRPISGRDAVRVMRHGKNYVGDSHVVQSGVYSGVSYTINDDKTITMSGTPTTNVAFDIIRYAAGKRRKIYPGTYTLSGGLTNAALVFVAYDGNEADSRIIVNKKLTTTGETATFTIDTMSYFGLYAYAYAGQSVDGVMKPQLEPGSTATPYEPYTGSTTDISLPETVYGGTLDVETGVVTVEYGHIASYAGESMPGDWISDRDVYVPDATPSTGAQVVYKLKTPYTIQLTKQKIAALSGVNTIYSDAGTLTVTGREDPRHTIVTLTDRIADLESAVAGV